MLDKVVQTVLASAKYRHISPALVRDLSRAEIGKGRGLKDTIKAVKNKLHQVAGAYLDGGGDLSAHTYERWLTELKDASSSPNADDLKRACREIMAHHSSTRERLPILDEFYSAIFDALPPVRSMVDVACGLNPLAIPWMPLAPRAEYHAYDIYSDMMAFLGDFMAFTSVRGDAETRDVVAQPPSAQVDLALVLKAIPCLEQIDKSGGRRLIDGLSALHMVVSFPVASLGGKNRGMSANYEAQFWELAADRNWSVRKLEFKTELAFLITTQTT